MRRPRSPVLVLLVLLAARVVHAACDTPEAQQALAEARAAVDVACPCADATGPRAHRACARRALDALVAAKRLTPRCGRVARRCAARSTCGRPGFVACCLPGRACRPMRSAARCAKRGGTPGPFASCCDVCAPRPDVTFTPTACPSPDAAAGCAPGTALTCQEAFASDGAGAACRTGHGDRATAFLPEDGVDDGSRARAWSFAIRPRGRRFVGEHREASGALRVIADGRGPAGASIGASDAATFRLAAKRQGGLLLTLRWFTGGLPAGSAARLVVRKDGAVIADVTEAPGAPVAALRNAIVTWTGVADVTVAASLTAPRDASVPSADLLWQLAFLDPAADDDHDGVPNRADPGPLDRSIPRPPPPSTRPRVLVVGLDGLGWDVLDPLILGAQLPSVGGVVASGARAFVDETAADPAYCCYCPPNWTTLATGRPLVAHAMREVDDEPWDRPVPAVWTLLERAGGTSTTVSFRNTAPPEPGTTFTAGIVGTDAAGHQRLLAWPAPTPGEERSEAMNRLQWTWPPLLFESLGLLPFDGPRPDAWRPFANDRAAAATVAALAARAPTDLTLWLVHSTDKSEHMAWCSVQGSDDAPIDTAALLTQAAGWTGPVEGPIWAYGSVASQSLEADRSLGRLLGASHYDYVVLVSDHAMSHGGPIFCGMHDRAPAFRGIFALAGPGVRAGASLGTVSALDVAPTLAYLLDLPVAEDLPGRVLEEAFTPEHLAAQPLRRVAHW